MFTTRVEPGIYGGAVKQTMSREDAEYFMRSTYDIDLDRMQEEALLNNLPMDTNLSADVTFPHAYIDWEPSANAAVYLVRPTCRELSREISRESILVLIVAKEPDPSGVFCSADSVYKRCQTGYQLDMWQSVGDLVLIYARPREFINPDVKCELTNWNKFIELTENWDSEKIIEEGYIHHLGCSQASPYLV